jgi:hypothetical protein
MIFWFSAPSAHRVVEMGKGGAITQSEGSPSGAGALLTISGVTRSFYGVAALRGFSREELLAVVEEAQGGTDLAGVPAERRATQLFLHTSGGRFSSRSRSN